MTDSDDFEYSEDSDEQMSIDEDDDDDDYGFDTTADAFTAQRKVCPRHRVGCLPPAVERVHLQ